MINPRTIAQEIAYADVATQAANLQEKQSELDAESSGLDSLSSALSDFQSAVDALNSDTDGPVTFAATSNNDSATVSANSQAQAGSYSFFVEPWISICRRRIKTVTATVLSTPVNW